MCLEYLAHLQSMEQARETRCPTWTQWAPVSIHSFVARSVQLPLMLPPSRCLPKCSARAAGLDGCVSQAPSSDHRASCRASVSACGTACTARALASGVVRLAPEFDRSFIVAISYRALLHALRLYVTTRTNPSFRRISSLGELLLPSAKRRKYPGSMSSARAAFRTPPCCSTSSRQRV